MTFKIKYWPILVVLLAAGRIQAQQNDSPGNSIRVLMKRVADWQWSVLRSEGFKKPMTDWTNGAFYVGIITYDRATGDTSFRSALRAIGDTCGWQTGPSRFFADDYCIGQMYTQLYEWYGEDYMLSAFRAQADSILGQDHTESLEWKNSIYLRSWAWCDALFMGPPSLAALTPVTGSRAYRDSALSLWWKTVRYLYDSKEHLFYRDSRFFSQREKNGAKVFWSRGNGWVLAGMARLLQTLPPKSAQRRRMEGLFREVAYRVASLQNDDGTWHASLLDPETYPRKESSGTGFYVYALAWGVRCGLLPPAPFLPVIQKGWAALQSCVLPSGKIGYVQLPAAEPGTASAEDSDTYGVGAFLMAGSEVFNLRKTGGKK